MRIPTDASFASLGFDSLSALEFRNRLESTLGGKFSTTLIWAYPNLPALLLYLGGRIVKPAPEPAAAAVPLTPVSASANAIVDNVLSLSDEEAHRFLRRPSAGLDPPAG